MLFCRWILSGVREETVVLFWCFATHAWDGTRKNVLQPKNSRFNLGQNFNSMQVHFPVQRSWWDKPGKCTLLHYWCNLKQQKCVRNCGDPLKSKIEPVLIVFKWFISHLGWAAVIAQQLSTHLREVVGSISAGCWAFFSFSECVLEEVPCGGATLLFFLYKIWIRSSWCLLFSCMNS